MTTPEHETIQATAREAALYQAGETIGAAKGLTAAAIMFEGVQKLYAGVPQDVADWLEQLAAELQQLAAKGKGRDHQRLAEIAAGVRELVPNLRQRHGQVASWLGDCAANVQHAAAQHRDQFAKHLANMPDPAGPIHTRQRLAVMLQRAAEAIGGRPR